MKIIPLLLLCFIVVSCSASKIRYVRTKDKPQEVIESSYTYYDEVKEPVHEIVATIEESPISESYPVDEMIDDTIAPTATSSSEISEDPSAKKERLRDALRAERKAKSARTMLVASTALLPIVFFPLATLVGLILFIIGAIKYNRANEARYVTLPGERALHHAKIFFYISLVMLIAMVLLVATVLVLFFFF